MNAIQDILSDRTHRLVLAVTLILTILAGVWKFSSRPEHVSGRQQTIEKALEGFSR